MKKIISAIRKSGISSKYLYVMRHRPNGDVKKNDQKFIHKGENNCHKQFCCQKFKKIIFETMRRDQNRVKIESPETLFKGLNEEIQLRGGERCVC